jgi:hypothetical protein
VFQPIKLNNYIGPLFIDFDLDGFINELVLDFHFCSFPPDAERAGKSNDTVLGNRPSL